MFDQELQKLTKKWASLPLGILIISMAGSTLNLTEHFGVVSNLADDWVQQFMLTCVHLGYYSGIIAGVLVDKMRNMWTFILSACLSGISFVSLAFLLDSPFTFWLQMLTCFMMFVAGLSASLATVCSIVSIAKNYDRMCSSLLVALMVSYMKTSESFDLALKKGFFPDMTPKYYLLMIGGILFTVYMIGSFLMKKVDLAEDIDRFCEITDPTGVLVYIIILGLYLISYWFIVELFQLHWLGVFIITGTLFFNFFVTTFVIWIARRKLNETKGKTPPQKMQLPEYTLLQMMKMPKYWLLLCSTMFVIGAGYSYEEKQVKISNEAQALSGLTSIDNMFWLCDGLGRFVGGVLSYFMLRSNKTNQYVFAFAYSIFSLIGNIGIFAIIGMDFDGGFWTLIPAVFVGLAQGGFWVVVAQILIDDGGLNNYGQIWGMAILFNFIGIFLFDQIIYMAGLTQLSASFFVILGLAATICTYFAWMDDKKAQERLKYGKDPIKNRKNVRV